MLKHISAPYPSTFGVALRLRPLGSYGRMWRGLLVGCGPINSGVRRLGNRVGYGESTSQLDSTDHCGAEFWYPGGTVFAAGSARFFDTATSCISICDRPLRLGRYIRDSRRSISTPISSATGCKDSSRHAPMGDPANRRLRWIRVVSLHGLCCIHSWKSVLPYPCRRLTYRCS